MSEFGNDLRRAAFSEVSVMRGYLETAESAQEATFNPGNFFSRAHFYVQRSLAFWKASHDFDKAYAAKDVSECEAVRLQLNRELARLRGEWLKEMKRVN